MVGLQVAQVVDRKGLAEPLGRVQTGRKEAGIKSAAGGQRGRLKEEKEQVQYNSFFHYFPHHTNRARLKLRKF